MLRGGEKKETVVEKVLFQVKKISKLEFWPLHRVLIEKYNHHTKDAEAFSAFLLKMLSIRPKVFCSFSCLFLSVA